MHTTWRKSSHSGGEGGQCVEFASLGTTIGVRDSVDPDGPVIRMRRDGFAGLVQQIKTGCFAWRTSSYTGQEGGTCVEVALLGAAVAVRDSADPGGPVLRFSRPAVAGLVMRIKAGSPPGG